MSDVTLLGVPGPLADQLHTHLNQQDGIAHLSAPTSAPLEGADVAVFLAVSFTPEGMPPQTSITAAHLDACRQARVGQVVVISSAAVHPPRHGHPGMVGEIAPARAEASPVARAWLDLEQTAETMLGDEPIILTLLRPAATPVPGAQDPLSRTLSGAFGATLPGHDPTIQVLHPEDLARAIAAVIRQRKPGLFNVAPAGNIPLRKALAAAGVINLPVPGVVQRVTRRRPRHFLDAIKYNFTVSGRKLAKELDVTPRYTSAQAAAVFGKPKFDPNTTFDDHGYEQGYTNLLRATNFKFLHDWYWRVEVTGWEHIPTQGGAMLVGVHRGFMPFDGAMCLTQIAKRIGRFPRFLIHPCLVKPAFQADFIRRIGGVIASRENADKLLADGELVGVFPEGINGAFTLYKDAYRLGNFGRDEYVKIALRNGTLIVPFATVGSAEIFPILGKIHWNWLRRHMEWPFLPVTPTPVPLPSKWHTRYLEPVPLGELYPPDAADDPAKVRAIGKDIEKRLLDAMSQMRQDRKSIFFGSIFKTNAEAKT